MLPWWSLVLALATFTIRASAQCLVTSYGAVGDGVADDTEAIQKCIDSCTSFVLFPNDKQFRIGRVTVSGRSKHLRMLPGSSLHASNASASYPGGQSEWYLLLFDKCFDCSLTGARNTKLDGHARDWVMYKIPGDRKVVRNWVDKSCSKATECRPRLLGVRDSQGVTLDSLFLTDSIYWTLHIIRSSHVTVTASSIHGDFAIANNDGVDIDSSSHVELTQLDVRTGDDAICIKTTTPGRAVSDVVVTNCTVQSRSSAIKLGSESRADFADIVFQDIKVLDSHRGIGVQLRDEGNMQNISFRSVVITAQLDNDSWWGAGEAILVTSLPREAGQSVHGTLRDVSFDGVVASSEGGVVLVGAPGGNLGNVSLKGVALWMEKLTDYPGGSRDLRPGPAGIVRGVRVPALHAEHLDLLTLQGVSFVYPEGKEDWRDDWGWALDLDARTVRQVQLVSVSVSNDSALAKLPWKWGTQAGGEDSTGGSGDLLGWHPGSIFMFLLFNAVWISMGFVAVRQSGFWTSGPYAVVKNGHEGNGLSDDSRRGVDLRESSHLA